MISADLLGIFEKMVRTVVRSNAPYKLKRVPGETKGTPRAFGGINVILCADFWQLKPVAGTYICSNPAEAVGNAQNGLELFWGTGPNTIQHFWQLTEVMRCKDVWYNDFLLACRFGRMTNDMYAFFHGHPTLCAANRECSCNNDVIDVPGIGPCKKSWRDEFLNGRNDMRGFIAETECEKCKAERTARCRVGDNATILDEEEDVLAYSIAPALFNFNVPRYFTILIRAKQFAATRGLQISWTYAMDTPLHADDRDLNVEKL